MIEVAADLADYDFSEGRAPHGGWDLIVSIFCHLPALLRVEALEKVRQ